MTARSVAVLLCCAGLMRPAVAQVPGETCHSRIILSLFPADRLQPNSEVVTQLARAAGGHLTFLRPIGPGLYSFLLTSTDRDPSCHRALEGLRRDGRVRSARIDGRRRAHD